MTSSFFSFFKLLRELALPVLVPYIADYIQYYLNFPSIISDMHIITDSKRILSLQHKLKKRLTDLMPDTAMRRVDIPKVNIDVPVNHNITIKKWYYYQDNSNPISIHFLLEIGSMEVEIFHIPGL